MKNVSKNDIAPIALFSAVDHDELFALIKDCIVRSLKPGEFICKFGEYGEDCGIVLSGLLNVELPGTRSSENASERIFLKEGDMVGEIAALSGYVRTADVKAVELSRVLLIPRKTLLSLFHKFPAFKSIVDEIYRTRVLASQLRANALFMGLPGDVMEKIVAKATLHSYVKGDTVFLQGDDADAFYLVRYGVFKITERGPDGKSRTLAYIKSGHYFGQIALMSESGKRMASVIAMDRAELIRISRTDFLFVIESYPRIKASLEKSIQKIEKKNLRMRGDEYMERKVSSIIDSGFVLSKELLVIDFTKCIHCNTCIDVCGSLHGDSRLVRKGVKLNNVLVVATSCRHCDDPTCMIKCPTGAINRGTAGEIYCDDMCIGCGMCARNCPYGNISMVAVDHDGSKEEKRGLFSRYLKRTKKDLNNEALAGGNKTRKKKKAVKCDMCRTYPVMVCVHNCPTGAARRIDPKEFFADVMGAG